METLTVTAMDLIEGDRVERGSLWWKVLDVSETDAGTYRIRFQSIGNPAQRKTWSENYQPDHTFVILDDDEVSKWCLNCGCNASRQCVCARDCKEHPNVPG